MKIPPALRLSFALALLTMSILMFGDLLGLLPDRQQATLDARKQLCESLALQFSSLLSADELEHAGLVATALAERNPDVRSTAIRRSNGELVITTAGHEKWWRTPVPGQSSSPGQVRLPLYDGEQLWGHVEVAFEPPQERNTLESLVAGKFGIVLFAGALGLLAYWLFMVRTLRQLDPSSVVPERVQAAFNALSEGVLILDNQEQILLANQSMSAAIGQDNGSLIGRRASTLNWSLGSDQEVLPWLDVIANGRPRNNVRLLCPQPSGEPRRFSVNCTAIHDASGKRQGVLATFDDLTEVEQKNVELRSALNQLNESKELIEKQNHELRYLAERDPLTSCLNRRSFNARCQALFDDAGREGSQLCCLMVDIDKFKSINDNFGHEVGDFVIKAVGSLLDRSLRESDVLSRWGGEEFCVVLPGLSDARASVIAQRIRRAVRSELEGKHTEDKIITVSIGLSSKADGASTLTELINQADHALYFSKRNGRNRVTRWTPLLENTPPGAPVEEETAPPREAAASTALVARLKELEAQHCEQTRALERADNYDPATGLPNRHAYLERLTATLERARREGQHVAVLSLSTAVYKRISDTLGFSMGTDLMRAIGERLQRLVRGTDTVARLNGGADEQLLFRIDGDEFGIVIPGLQNEASITWIVKRIIGGFEEPLIVDSYAIPVFIKIGVSVFPSDADSATQLITFASQARANCEGGADHGYHCYSEQLNAASAEQLQLESDLIRGLERGEFLLHYQPLVEARSCAINGVEALARWRHPQRGMVAAGEFIRLAESSGLMPILGKWVLNEAIRQAAQWDRQGHTELRFFVNVSTRQLRESNFLAEVLDSLSRHGLPPERLVLEITETALMENIEYTARLLAQLRRQAIKIAIDDFGVGYSSLSYLKRLEIDMIKVDRSFVQTKEHDREDPIVAAILAMARNLGVATVCEGIETSAQANMMRRLRCDTLQGYHFGKPMAPERLALLLSQNAAKLKPSRSA